MSTTNTRNSLVFVFSISLFLLNSSLFETSASWIDRYLKYLSIVLGLFLIGSITQIISPTLIFNFHSFFQNTTHFNLASSFLNRDLLIGFTSQTGVNGFILSVTASIVYSRIFNNPSKKSRVTYFIMYIFIILLIMLTGKRGFVLYNIAIAIYIFYKNSEYKFNSFIPIALFVSLTIYIIFNTHYGDYLIERTVSQADATTGRSYMNTIMWNRFTKAPLVGQGTFTTTNYIDFAHGHNIYLQVLSEHGLIGIITILLFFTVNLFNTNRLLTLFKKDNLRLNHLTISLYLQLLFLFWGLTGNPLYDDFPLYFYFMAISMTYSMKKEKNIKEKYNEESKYTDISVSK